MGAQQSSSTDIIGKASNSKAYTSLSELQDEINKTGVNDIELVIGIDFTGSNLTSGKNTFGQCLHTVDPMCPNPYENVMTFMADAMQPYNKSNTISVFGFGDKTTGSKAVFNFNKNNEPFHSMEDILTSYHEQLEARSFAGPSSLAPIILKTIEMVKTNRKLCVLVIVCDGQVSDIDVNRRALEEASNYPISIICVGVGDGPFGVMDTFDNCVHRSKFDNFNFIEYAHHFPTKAISEKEKEDFVFHALQELPEQYTSMKELGYITSEHPN